MIKTSSGIQTLSLLQVPSSLLVQMSADSLSGNYRLGLSDHAVWEPSAEALAQAQHLIEQPHLSNSRAEFFAAVVGSTPDLPLPKPCDGEIGSSSQTGPLDYSIIYDMLLECVEKRLGLMTAKMILRRTCDQLGYLPESIRERHVDKLVTAMERRLTLYLKPREVRVLMNELKQCVIEDETTSTASSSTKIDINVDVDVSRARDEAINMALEMGLGRFRAVKVATVVSELARNIISYANAGTIELRPLEGLKRGVMIIATDSGPGIPHLDQVLNGQWRSPKSMGQGIRGCIKVMTTFDIKTIEGVGTTVTTTMSAD